jgi:hypothetical protein
VTEDAGIEPRTVATLAVAARHSITTRLDVLRSSFILIVKQDYMTHFFVSVIQALAYVAAPRIFVMQLLQRLEY